MTVFSFRLTTSRRALIALALPLAALVPLTSPLDQAAALRLGLSAGAASELAQLGAASAATRTTKKRVVRKAAVAKGPVKRVCTTRKVKGKLVKSCKTVKIVPLAPIITMPAVYTTPPVVPAPPPPLAVAPPPLPPAPYIAAQPVQIPAIAYYWIDQADGYANALGNSPPDFTFRYDGVDCWAWQSRNGEVLIVEPGRDGVVQYYFGPRDTAPYLVRDSYFAYGFDGRDLVQIYDNSGRVYTGALTNQQRYESQDLQARGRALYSASLRQRRWDGGAALAWGSQYSSYGYNDGWNYGWSGFWREDRDWDRFERDHRRDHPPRRMDEERRHRRDARHDYDDWRRGGGHGAPPPTGNPIVTPGANGGTSGGAMTPPHGPRTPPGGAQGGPPPPVTQQGPAPAPAPLPPAPPPPPPQAAPVPPPAPEPPRRRPHRDVDEDAPVEDKTLPAGEAPVRAPRQWNAPPAPPPAPAPAPVQYEAPYVAPAPPPPPPAPVRYEAPLAAPAPPPPPPPAPVQYQAPAPAPAPSPPPPPPPAPAPEPAPREQIITGGDSDRP